MTDLVPTHGLGLLALAALVVAAVRLARHRARGTVDALLVGVGGLLVGLVLTGMVLDLTGVGLRPVTWAAGVAVLAAVGLGLDALLTRRRSPGAWVWRPAAPSALVPWLVVGAATVAVAAVAIGLSVRSLSAADVPPLALSLGRVQGTEVQVEVSSGEAVGPLELRTSTDGSEVSYPLVDVDAGGTRTVTLSLPRSGRVTITLNYPDQIQPLRTLVLDR